MQKAGFEVAPKMVGEIKETKGIANKKLTWIRWSPYGGTSKKNLEMGV
jgi:hypothetical protein